MFHSCGSCSWLFEDFIDMRIDAVDTLQPEATDMAPVYLKKKFGDRLAFHGCMPTGGVMANGTAAQVREAAQQLLATMMPGGGYCFAPSHQLQDNTPTENALAMYEAAHEFGVYK
jgi:uroporphyrinogen decarboxylase